MYDLDASYITSLRNAITQLYDGVAELIATQGDQPKPDSLADRELRESARPESIVSACSIAMQLNEYSGEHLTAFVKTLTEPGEPLAAWTCVRSMLESCALSAWLTDPTIDDTERISRTFARRYEELEQQLKFCRVAALPQSELDLIGQRTDEVERVAMSLGYPRIENPKGKRTGIAQRMPGATEIIGRVLDEEKMYRLLSAINHGHSWAMIALGYKPAVVAAHSGDVRGIGVQLFEKQLNFTGAAYLGIGGGRAFAKAVWHYWSYMGWDCEPLAVLLDKTFDQLRANEVSRFWRPR